MQIANAVRHALTSRLAPTQARILAAVYFVIAGSLIFVLPYHFISSKLVYSYSYDFGFNNHVAILAVLASVLVAPFFLGRAAERAHAVYTPQGDTSLLKRLLLLAVAAHCIVIAFYFFVTVIVGWGDGYYFLNSAVSMESGLRPYVGFEYAYGPALLYPIHWLNVAGLSVHSAYSIFYLFLIIAGLGMAWSFARLLPIAANVKACVFILLAGISFVSLALNGANYTLIRFLTPLWILALLAKSDERHDSLSSQCLIAFSGILAVDAISPELGTVLAITGFAYFVLKYLLAKEKRYSQILAATGCLAIHGVFFFVLMPKEFRDSMLAFGQGGLNFPVVASVTNTFYLVSLAYAVKRHFPPQRGSSTLFTILTIFSLGSVAGALTHTDVGHVVWDGLGVFVLAVVGSARSGKAVRLLVCVAPILLFCLGLYFTPWAVPPSFRLAARGLNSYLPTARMEAFALRTGHLLHVNPDRFVRRIRSSADVAEAQKRELSDEVSLISRYPSSAAPMGIPYLLKERLLHTNMAPDYYLGITNVLSPETVARKVDELKRENAAILVLPFEILKCQTEAAEQRDLSLWLGYPYFVHRKYDSCHIYDPFVAYIHTNYEQLDTNKTLWVRKDIGQRPMPKM